MPGLEMAEVAMSVADRALRGESALAFGQNSPETVGAVKTLSEWTAESLRTEAKEIQSGARFSI